MKVIFLDVDGVLNFSATEARSPSGYIGIAEKCVRNLKSIVDKTGAFIVLTSDWKDGWSPDNDRCDPEAKYLNKKLNRHGLHIMTATHEDARKHRGAGISEWLKRNPHVTNWVVLDDELFEDYAPHGILPHYVQTDFYTDGLNEAKAEQAIALLNREGEKHA